MMLQNTIYQSFCQLKATQQHAFAVLIDPDKKTTSQIATLAQTCEDAQVDYIFIGGSLLVKETTQLCINTLKSTTSIPLVIFPGSPSQVCEQADALLYLSLISGRNPELLIGQHVQSAALVKASGLEVIPTGYMLIDGGNTTTVSYISQTLPIPQDKADIALCTAWAGEMLGLKTIYMDAGSGAKSPITESLIAKVSSQINVPLIIGGGIKTAEKIEANCRAGATINVVGNAIEKSPSLILEMAQATKEAKSFAN